MLVSLFYWNPKYSNVAMILLDHEKVKDFKNERPTIICSGYQHFISIHIDKAAKQFTE